MLAVAGGGQIAVRLQPAQPHPMADHHIKGQVILKAHIGIGLKEGQQR
jgi:hypothetical protein